MKKENFLKICLIVSLLFIFCPAVYAVNNNSECAKLADFQKDLQYIFNLIKFAIPLLIIGLSSYDFIKAIAQKDEKDVKKAFQRLFKRFIYAVFLFFLPVLLTLILNLIIENATVCIS